MIKAYFFETKEEADALNLEAAVLNIETDDGIKLGAAITACRKRGLYPRYLNEYGDSVSLEDIPRYVTGPFVVEITTRVNKDTTRQTIYNPNYPDGIE